MAQHCIYLTYQSQARWPAPSLLKEGSGLLLQNELYKWNAEIRQSALLITCSPWQRLPSHVDSSSTLQHRHKQLSTLDFYNHSLKSDIELFSGDIATTIEGSQRVLIKSSNVMKQRLFPKPVGKHINIFSVYNFANYLFLFLHKGRKPKSVCSSGYNRHNNQQ